MSKHGSPAIELRHSESSIAGVIVEQTKLVVRWSDGERAAFHYIWLRDNCSCRLCGDKSGGHRYLELNSIPLDVSPERATVNDQGQLEITWATDQHPTVYESGWLREHSYSQRARTARRHQPVLWDARLMASLPSCRYPDVASSESHRLEMFERLRDYGFVLLREVPTESDEIERLAGLVGYIRETHYGRVFDLVSTRKQRILAQTSHAIRPHHDELFRDPTPGILIMHCLIASEDGGGESILVDGFNAAQALSQTDPAAYELLTRTPIAHHRSLSDGVDDADLRAVWQTITLDYNGDVAAVRLNERTIAPLELPDRLIEPTYAALQELLALVYDQQAAVCFRLEPGDAVVFDNHRVLHARTAFAGNRHIRQCHVDRDEFLSRLGALKRRSRTASPQLTG